MLHTHTSFHILWLSHTIRVCYTQCCSQNLLVLVFVIVCLSCKPTQIPILLSAKLYSSPFVGNRGAGLVYHWSSFPYSCELWGTRSSIICLVSSLIIFDSIKEGCFKQVAFKEAGGERYKQPQEMLLVHSEVSRISSKQGRNWLFLSFASHI